MKLARSFNSGAFRFALLVTGIFGLGSFVLLMGVEREVSHFENNAAVSGLQSETIILLREMSAGGLPQLMEAIERRQTPTVDQQYRYLVVDTNGRRIAGNLPMEAAHIGWGTVQFLDPHAPPGEEGKTETLRTLGTRLPDGKLLAVATDIFDFFKLRAALHSLELTSAIVITILALLGGYLTGMIFLRRLERVNEAVGRIMIGSLSERLPPIGMAPEFDHLSQNLNLMLDRISALMEGLRQVSTDIAHDLRTPITRLRQMLETMQDATSVEEYRDAAELALTQTDEIMDMFKALLRIGVIEAGEARQLFTRVDLAEIAERVAQIYQPMAEDGGRNFETNFEPAWLVGDPELLAQALANLIDNAIKYTPEGALVRVEVVCVDGVCQVIVSDDGPGIPPGERTKVLRRFYRIDTSRSAPGAGLGLSLVDVIVGLHDATLQLESNHPGLLVRLSFPEISAHSQGALR